eukprot:gene13354-15781_t
MQKITANDGSSGDFFGRSVALSGTHVVIGAYGDDSERGSVYVYSVNDSDATFVQKNGRGSVYVYNVTDSGARLVQKVTASAGSSSFRFGYDVALSRTHLVVGAPSGHGDDNSYQGSVYVYSVADSGTTFLQKVTANESTSGDRFGFSVAVSGTHLVVGARYGNFSQGSVYVYNVTNLGATFVQK